MKKLSLFLISVLFVLVACRSDDTAEKTSTPGEAVATSTPTISTVGSESTPTPSSAESGSEWIAIEPGGDTRCAHNTPYTYWVRTGTTNKLLIYFQDGGGCWDAASCGVGSTFYDSSISTNDNPNGHRGGILDINNPENPFSDYTIVFIPSCTGDVHWGGNIQSYPKSDGSELTIYHHGFFNASAALNWAYANVTNPESIFVTGCSAGSVGSITHAPYIIEQYPDVPVTQLGDSLAFVYHRPINVQTDYKAHDNFASWIPALKAIEPGTLIMSDFYNAVANYYPDYTFSQYNTEADNVQTRFYEAIGGDPDNFPVDLAANLTRIHQSSPNFRSYTASGDLHCILPRPQFYTTEIDGVRIAEWVADLADNQPVSSVRCETCQNETE